MPRSPVLRSKSLTTCYDSRSASSPPPTSSPTPGGLVRALLPLLRASGGTWVGWTGEPDDVPEPFTHDGVNLQPILVTSDEVQDYYEGFSNDTLWPLYH